FRRSFAKGVPRADGQRAATYLSEHRLRSSAGTARSHNPTLGLQRNAGAARNQQNGPASRLSTIRPAMRIRPTLTRPHPPLASASILGSSFQTAVFTTTPLGQ